MVTAELSRDKSVILLDNINTAGGRKLDSPALASVLTATTWTDRILKETQMTDLPNKALWFLTANNPQMSRELARRSVRIRLVPAEEQPWLRTAFKYPDLKGWARTNRGRLIWAALILARAWQVGRLRGKQRLGSYESWSEVIGGILDVNQGIDGFLEKLEDVYREANSDTEACATSSARGGSGSATPQFRSGT